MSVTRKNPRGITGPFIAALENLNVGVWDWSPATDEVCWTLRVGEIYGMPAGFLPGSLAEVVDYIHPEDRAAWKEDVKSCLAGEKDHDCVFR
ncbi:MAG TPA: PAS domain-containing protein, partial [Wenzhouxiangella sp.]|nr:PAS domain-containing protein [Wenzhouxiangella sp.]